MIDRRRFIQLALAAGVTPYWQLWCADASAQVVPQSIVGHGFTERVLTHLFLVRDPALLVAFGEALSAKGTNFRAEFDRAHKAFGSLSDSDKLAKLETQLAHGAAVNLRATIGSQSSSIGNVAEALTTRTGLPLTIGEALDGISLRSAVQNTSLTAILGRIQQGTTKLELRPVFGDLSSVPQLAAQRLRDVAEGNGLLGLVAGAGAALGKLTDPQAYEELSLELSKLSTAAGTLLRGTLDLKQFPSTSAIQGSITTVGRLIGAKPQTLSSINKAVETIGSVVTGAQAGMAFGPIGGVAGGVLGLVSSLFGGEPARDATTEALSALNAKLSEIHADIVAGFKAMSQQLNAVSQQIVQGFNGVNAALLDLRSSVTALHVEMRREFSAVQKMLGSIQRDSLVDKTTAIIDATAEHERAYRNHVVDRDNRDYVTTARELRLSVSKLRGALETPEQGFAGAAVVGTGTLQDIIAKRLTEPAAVHELLVLLPLEHRFQSQVSDRVPAPGVRPFFTTPPLPGSAPLPAVPDVWKLSQEVALALRHGRYQNSAEPLITAAAINELHGLLLPLLVGIDSSGEWQRMSHEQRAWIPNPTAPQNVPAITPADLWFVASSIGNASVKLTDPNTAIDVLKTATPLVRDRVAIHQLLTEQSVSCALLYIRRRAARLLAGQIAKIFSGPTMTAARIIRSVISSVLSPSALTTAAYAPLIRTEAEALRLFAHPSTVVPLTKYRGSVGTTGAPPVIFTNALEKLLKFAEHDGNLTPAHVKTLDGIVQDTITRLAQLLVQEASTTAPLQKTLADIVSGGLVLAIIEACIDVRLNALTAAKATVPSFRRYSTGFDEYILLAAHCLGQAKAANGGHDQAAALPLVMAHLAGPHRPVVVTGHLNPAGARPYPVEIGHFWGWAAEDFAFDDPVGDDLLRALLDPRCALAGANGPLMRSAWVCMALESAIIEITLAQTGTKRFTNMNLVNMLRSALP